MSITSYPVPCITESTAAMDSHTRIEVSVPGSKSITNRALLLATLAEGESLLEGALFSDDSTHFFQCLLALGFQAESDEKSGQIRITGLGGKIPCNEASLYVGSAGTAARFLSALLGVSKGTFHLNASEQMCKRPMAPLLECLRALGCEITYEGEEEHFPFTLKGNGFCQHNITVNIDQSSQFLSALLIAAILSPQDMEIQTTGSHGTAYIDMTLQMMEQFGVKAPACDLSTPLRIQAGQQYLPRHYKIEPDVSAACYFYAMAAILGITVTVKDVMRNSLQGDIAFLDLLEKMGCSTEETPDGITLTGPKNGALRGGFTVDISSYSDQTITLAAIAPFADAPIQITGIGHIRHQESNRIAAICENLTAMGISCVEEADGIRISPGVPVSAHIKTHDDHRLAMGFALTGLRTKGILIENPTCCKKTFADYFDVLERAISDLTTL